MRIRITVVLLAMALVLVGTPISAFTDQEQQPDSPPSVPVEDPIRELNLSPEQRERIREIREQLRAERASSVQRLREANWALENALDADNPDEAQLEQLMRDVSAAQAANLRIRVSSELKIRRVLTSEQLATWRHLRRMARQFRRNRHQDNIDGRRRELIERRRGLRNQRNGLEPVVPRRVDPQRRTPF